MLLDEGRRRRSGAVVLYSPASSSEAEGIHGRMGLHWLVGDAKRGGGGVGRVDWMDWIGGPEEGGDQVELVAAERRVDGTSP